MTANLDGLIAERDQIEQEIAKLNDKRDALLKRRDEIKAEMAQDTGGAGSEAQSKLKIEDDQAAEALRKNEHDLSEQEKRRNDLEKEIIMQQQSSIV